MRFKSRYKRKNDQNSSSNASRTIISLHRSIFLFDFCSVFFTIQRELRIRGRQLQLHHREYNKRCAMPGPFLGSQCPRGEHDRWTGALRPQSLLREWRLVAVVHRKLGSNCHCIRKAPWIKLVISRMHYWTFCCIYHFCWSGSIPLNISQSNINNKIRQIFASFLIAPISISKKGYYKYIRVYVSNLGRIKLGDTVLAWPWH